MDLLISPAAGISANVLRRGMRGVQGWAKPSRACAGRLGDAKKIIEFARGLHWPTIPAGGFGRVEVDTSICPLVDEIHKYYGDDELARHCKLLRLQASSTTARYRNPFAVGTKVMSATQNLSGPTAVKSRPTRSGAGRAPCHGASSSHLPAATGPVSPSPRIRRAIRLRPCLLPVARSSTWLLGDPYVSREAA